MHLTGLGRTIQPDSLRRLKFFGSIPTASKQTKLLRRSLLRRPIFLLTTCGQRLLRPFPRVR